MSLAFATKVLMMLPIHTIQLGILFVLHNKQLMSTEFTVIFDMRGAQHYTTMTVPTYVVLRVPLVTLFSRSLSRLVIITNNEGNFVLI